MVVQGSRSVHEILLLILCAEGAQEVGLLLQRKRWGREVKAGIHPLWRPDKRTAHEALGPSKIITLERRRFLDLLIEAIAARCAYAHDFRCFGLRREGQLSAERNHYLPHRRSLSLRRCEGGPAYESL